MGSAYLLHSPVVRPYEKEPSNQSVKKNKRKPHPQSFRVSPYESGFTLLEALIVVAIVGILGAILAPGWLHLTEGTRLTTGRDEIYVGLRDTQVQAQAQKTAWQFSLRERNGRIEWTNHPRSVSPLDSDWEVLDSVSIQVDDETTFASSGGIYYVRFDEYGNVQYRLGRMTLSSKNAPDVKRCVIVSTLIGAMRKSKEQPTPRDGKLCY